MSVHLVGELSKADLAPTDRGVHHEETIASSFEDEDKVGETIGERGDDKRRKTGLSGRDGGLPWDDHLQSVEPEAGQAVALDWAHPAAREFSHALIGMGVDWDVAPPAQQAHKFPGGASVLPRS